MKRIKINMSKKKMIIVAVAVLVIIAITVVIIVVNKNKKKDTINTLEEISEKSEIDMNNLENAEIQDGLKVNTSSKAHEEKTYNEFKLSELTLNSENGETNFVIKVANTGTTKTEEQYVQVVCLKQDGSEIGELYLLISALDPGQTISATATIADDYINLYDYKIEPLKK